MKSSRVNDTFTVNIYLYKLTIHAHQDRVKIVPLVIQTFRLKRSHAHVNRDSRVPYAIYVKRI